MEENKEIFIGAKVVIVNDAIKDLKKINPIDPITDEMKKFVYLVRGIYPDNTCFIEGINIPEDFEPKDMKLHVEQEYVALYKGEIVEEPQLAEGVEEE